MIITGKLVKVDVKTEHGGWVRLAPFTTMPTVTAEELAAAERNTDRHLKTCDDPACAICIMNPERKARARR